MVVLFLIGRTFIINKKEEAIIENSLQESVTIEESEEGQYEEENI